MAYGRFGEGAANLLYMALGGVGDAPVSGHGRDRRGCPMLRWYGFRVLRTVMILPVDVNRPPRLSQDLRISVCLFLFGGESLFLRPPRPPIPTRMGGRVDSAAQLFLRIVAPGRKRPGCQYPSQPPHEIGRRAYVPLFAPLMTQRTSPRPKTFGNRGPRLRRYIT